MFIAVAVGAIMEDGVMKRRRKVGTNLSSTSAVLPTLPNQRHLGGVPKTGRNTRAQSKR